MRRFFLVPFVTLLLSGAGCAQVPVVSEVPPEAVPQTSDSPLKQKMTLAFPGILPAEEIQNKRIRLTTEKGDVVFDLFADTTPMAVSNFVYLTKQTFYDRLTFHRREEGFVIQGGDPLGSGYGGPGYKFSDELADAYTYDRGIVAMANSGPNTNGSQFFIMLGNTPLPKNYTIFGKVVEGMDVVDKIQVGDEIIKVTVESM
ncbi:MAG TPA: peptidylprolyl isomerase [Patescibacteria group bacterium]|nr:peptidylprolyl isomerase [Patescibacteria group bacterium]